MCGGGVDAVKRIIVRHLSKSVRSEVAELAANLL